MGVRSGIRVKLLLFNSAASVFLLLLSGCERPATDDPFHGASCFNRLKMIDTAKAKWGAKNNKSTNDIATWNDLRFSFTRNGDIPICPDGGGYTIGRLDEPTRCNHPGHASW